MYRAEKGISNMADRVHCHS